MSSRTSLNEASRHDFTVSNFFGSTPISLHSRTAPALAFSAHLRPVASRRLTLHLGVGEVFYLNRIERDGLARCEILRLSFSPCSLSSAWTLSIVKPKRRKKEDQPTREKRQEDR